MIDAYIKKSQLCMIKLYITIQIYKYHNISMFFIIIYSQAYSTYSILEKIMGNTVRRIRLWINNNGKHLKYIIFK